MSNILGVHWIPIHGRPSDLDYMQRLQPGSIKIVDPDVTQISRAHQAAPDALIVLRDHPLSEQHDDMRRDPEGTGVRHARRWKEKRDEYYNQAAQRNLPMPPLDNTVVLGINEPRVWDALAQTVRYTVAFLRECRALGLRAGALNLSVGWPANTGPDTPADWQPYALVEPEIRSGNHYLFLHEYFDERGPEHNWRWWCGRFKWCAWQVPIIIGESGLDKYVSDPGVDRNRRGWQGWLSAEDYARHLHRYATLCAQDGRIHSIQPFTTDGANDWHSFDTEPAHNVMLTQQWPRISPQKPTTLIPGVGTAPQPQPNPTGPTAVVNVAAGANVRRGPGTHYALVGAEPQNTVFTVIGRDANREWWQVRTRWGELWVSDTVVQTFNVQSVPETRPTMQPSQPGPVPRLVHPVESPAYRQVSQVFGVNPHIYDRFGLDGHNGVDFRAPVGARIRAVADGRVAEVANSPTGYGLYCRLEHSWGHSLYAHLSQQLVAVGTLVKAGQVIGLSGNTGFSTGAHLHFGIRVSPFTRGRPFDGYSDPLPYLQSAIEPGQPVQPVHPAPPVPTENIPQIVREAAREFGVNEGLLLALAMAESSFNPRAVSRAGARGLLQVMPATWDDYAARLGVSDPFSARDSARVGAAHLKFLLDRYQNNIGRAVLAYNMGAGNTDRGAAVPLVVAEWAAKVVFGHDLLNAVGG